MYAPLQDLVSSLLSREGTAIPLQGVHISGEIMGARAKITLRQRYLHKGEKAIEAIYTFPIPSDAAVIGFSMECAGRRMESEVKEKQSARQAYQEAVQSGDGAALLEQAKPNVFTAFVGNILPNEETVIETVYVQKLSGNEGALRLLIPTLVAPRYTPAGSGDSADALQTPPIADKTIKLYGLTIDLIFDLGRDISIESPSHEIETQRLEGKRVRVKLERPEAALDRDLVLQAFSDDNEQGTGCLAHKEAGKPGTFALTIVPDFLPKLSKKPGKDVVFVVDVSGSMEGLSIEQAQSALKLCLRHLREGDRVQIIAFSTSFTTFQKQLSPFTQGTLEAADHWVNSLEANGGTEMLDPMMAAVNLLKQSAKNRARIVVLMTDGQVSNEHHIVSSIASHAQGARVYTFGIGTSVSDFIVRELAKATGGAAEFIFPGERIDTKVTAQFTKATALRLENPGIRFTGTEVFDLCPQELSPLVDSDPFTLYGRYEKPGLGSAEISGTLCGQPFSVSIPIELPENSSKPDLETLWAAERIGELEKIAMNPANPEAASAAGKKAVGLSIQYRIACQFTSMLVVERRSGERKSADKPESVVVPASPPAGWGMYDEGDQFDHYAAQSSTRAGTIGPKGMMMLKAMQAAGPSAMRASMPKPTAKPMAPPKKSAARPPAAMPPMPAAARPPAPMPVAPPASLAMPMPPASMSMDDDELESVPRGEAGGGSGAPSPQAAPGLGGSIAQAVKGVFSKIFGGDSADSQGITPAAPPPPPPPPAAPARPRVQAAADTAQKSRMKDVAPPPAPAPAPKLNELPASTNELMECQLASGLWELSPSALSVSSIEDARLLATAQALLRCYQEGMDTNHPMFGVPIRKAVEALCDAIRERPADQAGERALKAAIAAALLLSTRRLRTAVIAAAEAVHLKDFANALSTAEAAKQKLLELKIN